MTTRKPRKPTRTPRPEGAPRKSSRTDPDSTERSGDHDTDERRQAIATAAYYRAEHRGFTPGYELDDWLAAEEELEQ